MNDLAHAFVPSTLDGAATVAFSAVPYVPDLGWAAAAQAMGLDAAALASLRAAILAHAAEQAPREACGLLLWHGTPPGDAGAALRWWPCRNVSRQPGEFEVCPEDWAAAEDSGAPAAVVHSHVFAPPEPSMADRVMCERTGLPWLVVSHPTGSAFGWAPGGWRAPLLGRPFVHGVLDCYSLIRDHFEQALGMVLPDYARRPHWWELGDDLYRCHFEDAGFVDVSGQAPQLHDVVLMQVASRVANHAGVLVEGGTLLHHCMGRLSSRDVYGGYWRRVTVGLLRHRSLWQGVRP